MPLRDLAGLMFLGAIWGASFLFLRIAVPELGVFTTAFLRVSIATLVMLPIALSAPYRQAYRTHWRAICVLGFFNYALPFSLLAFATQTLPASVASILNATAPIWAMLVAWAWLQQRPDQRRIAGMVLGFLGVLILSSHKSKTGSDGYSLATIAALLATLSYGTAANYSKRYLSAMPVIPLVMASQCCAALYLLPFGLTQWPVHSPSWTAWAAVAALGIACTSMANLVYFKLISRLGPTPAISSTFLIPMFGMLWGSLFLSEKISVLMLAGCGVILLGTALASGALQTLLRR